MVHIVYGLLITLLLAASHVSAANIIDLGPSDYKNWGSGSFQHHPNGINAKFGQTIRMPPMNTNLTVTRNPVVPYGSIANGAKNFTRINPASAAASAALTALFLGLDWVFDQELDSWARVSEGEIIEPNDLNLFCGYPLGPGLICAPSAESYCQLNPNPSYFGFQFRQDGTVVDCMFYAGPNQTRPTAYYSGTKASDCPAPSYYSSSAGGCILEGEYIPVTDADFQHLESYLPSANPTEVGNAAGDIQRKVGSPLPGYTDMQMEGPASTTGPESTTTTTTETGDNIVTSTTTTTNYNYGDTTITTTNTTTSTTYTNGNHTSTETTTETPGELPVVGGGGGAGDWPGFCDWATVVCDFITWMREPFTPPEVEWPLIEDQDFEEDYEFSLVAECPEPYTINLVLFGPITFSWQPFCTLAGYIKPLVLISAYIFAAFIALGISRGRT